jgi:hypothetical protein
MEDLLISIAIVVVALLSFFAGFGVSRLVYFDFLESFERKRVVTPLGHSLPPIPPFDDDLEVPRPPPIRSAEVQKSPASLKIRTDQVIRKGSDFESL